MDFICPFCNHEWDYECRAELPEELPDTESGCFQVCPVCEAEWTASFDARLTAWREEHADE